MKKTITVSKDGFIELEKFKDYVDISKVVYYQLEPRGKNLILSFYDGNKKILRSPINEQEVDLVRLPFWT